VINATEWWNTSGFDFFSKKKKNTWNPFHTKKTIVVVWSQKKVFTIWKKFGRTHGSTQTIRANLRKFQQEFLTPEKFACSYAYAWACAHVRFEVRLSIMKHCGALHSYKFIKCLFVKIIRTPKIDQPFRICDIIRKRRLLQFLKAVVLLLGSIGPLGFDGAVSGVRRRSS